MTHSTDRLGPSLILSPIPVLPATLLVQSVFLSTRDFILLGEALNNFQKLSLLFFIPLPGKSRFGLVLLLIQFIVHKGIISQEP